MDRNEAGIFAIGFVVGAIAGAVVAILYTPEPGWATRGIIRDKVGEFKDKVKESTAVLGKRFSDKRDAS